MMNLFLLRVVGLAFSLASVGFAQEAFVFGNYNAANGLDAPVFDANGNRLSGTNYVAMLYGGGYSNVLQPGRSFGGQVMRPFPFTLTVQGEAGYFYGGYVEIPEVCSVPTWLQVRAWDARLASSYEEVAGLGVGGYGQSPLFQLQGSDVCLPNPRPPVPLIGLESFSLVPEPSTWALLGLGGMAVGWAARRQRQRDG
jgi:hypothetical protein